MLRQIWSQVKTSSPSTWTVSDVSYTKAVFFGTGAAVQKKKQRLVGSHVPLFSIPKAYKLRTIKYMNLPRAL